MVARSGMQPQQTNHYSSHDDLFQRRDFWMLCLAAFVAMMLSKLGTLLPAMSADDYFFAFGGGSSGQAATFVSQGRALSYLMVAATDAMHVSFVSVSLFAFFLASAMISLAIAGSIALIKDAPKNYIHHYIAAFFAATHPYLSSYFLFRMTLFGHALVYGTLFVALLLVARSDSNRNKAACIVLLAIVSYSSQIVLILFAIAAGAWALARFCREKESGLSLRRAARGIASVILITGLSTVLYLVTNIVLQRFLHVSASSSYTPHIINGSILGTLHVELKLVQATLFSSESIEPQWIKVWILLILAIMIVRQLIHRPNRGLACVVLLIGGSLVTVSPMALSWGRLVPRTFSPIGLCLALTICLACDGTNKTREKAFSIAMAIPIFAFCSIGASLFYQQFMLSQWDQRTALAIYNRVAAKFGSSTPIRIAVSWPVHQQPLGYNGPGINESAFYSSWSYRGLFAVATGARPEVAQTDPKVCHGMPRWPNPGSVKKLADGAALVCMTQ